MVDRVLPGNETILLIPAIEINGIPQLVGATTAPISAPTSAILSRYIAITTNASTNSGSGGNVSCTIRDDLTLGLTDSGTDGDRSVCSVGDSEALTFFNAEAEFNFFRDDSLTSTSSAFNMANDLVRAADVPYVIAHRIGYGQNVAAATGQEWDFYYVWTDNPVPVYADGGNQLTKQKFISKNIVNVGYVLAA